MTMMATKKIVTDKPEAFANLDAYLGRFATTMADRVAIGLAPLFDPETDSLSPNVRALTECKMKPYPAQAVAVEGICRMFGRGKKTVILNGEMGTGKTPLACWIGHAWAAQLNRPMRMIVTAPNQLVYKWQRHFREILPGCDARVISNWADVAKLRGESVLVTKDVVTASGQVTQLNRRWRRPDRHQILILPRDKSKLGYAWRPAPVAKRVHRTNSEDMLRRYYYHCPACGARVRDSDDNDAWPEHFTTKSGKIGKKRTCSACDEPLWQAYNGNKTDRSADDLPVPGTNPRKVAPCVMLRKIGYRADLYFADEVHELKGHGTLQGQMFADLCNVSDRIVLLTGTLVGGYAENLLHLLWRSMPHRMVADRLTHDHEGFTQFNKLYGVLQTVKRYTKEREDQSINDLTMGRGKAGTARVKCLPGISPTLFVNYLLDSTVFIRLPEMHAHLPRFNERVHNVPMDEDMDEAMKAMQYAFDNHRNGVKICRAWSAARACFIRWPDKPHVEPYTVMDLDDMGTPIPAFDVESLPKRERPKERRVRRLIQRNMLRGRKTWVFTELAGTDGKPAWDVMDEWAEYLGQHGIRVAVLRSQAQGGPKPEDRETWIAKRAPKVDAIISNPSLVKTGLDLFDFPSIVYAFPGDNTYTLRQASRRSWRLGQTHDCDVDYVVYTAKESKSVQEAALSLMAKKMEASLAIEGDFSSEGLAALSSGEDMGSQLAKFISGELDGLDPARTAFDRYRAKMESVMPQLGGSVPAPAIAPPEPAESPESDSPVPGTPESPVTTDEPVLVPPGLLATIQDSYSADRICSGKIRRPFEWQGALMVATGTIGASLAKGGLTVKATRVIPQDEWDGEIVSHGSNEHGRGFYHGVAVSFGRKRYVLDGSATFFQADPRLKADAELLPASRPNRPKIATVPGATSGAEVTQILGVKPSQTTELFEQPSLAANEPQALSERKRLRRAALCKALKIAEFDELDGDRARSGSRWFHIVSKARRTVRERNFTATASDYPGAIIAFVEPADEVGPTSSDCRVTESGIEYVVSLMTVNDYLGGNRLPANVEGLL